MTKLKLCEFVEFTDFKSVIQHGYFDNCMVQMQTAILKQQSPIINRFMIYSDNIRSDCLNASKGCALYFPCLLSLISDQGSVYYN